MSISCGRGSDSTVSPTVNTKTNTQKLDHDLIAMSLCDSPVLRYVLDDLDCNLFTCDPGVHGKTQVNSYY